MKVRLNVSLSLDINSSIVQGSGIGSSLFVVYISDLKASGKDNCIVKFADDCSLLVPGAVNNFDNKLTSLSVSAQKYT